MKYIKLFEQYLNELKLYTNYGTFTSNKQITLVQMNHLKKMNEMIGDNIFTNNRVIDVTDITDENIKKMIYDSPFGNGSNRSYFKFYVCDQLKHISKAKDPTNVVRFPKHNPDYVYEKGDDPISDYFMENGAKLGEELIILINW